MKKITADKQTMTEFFLEASKYSLDVSKLIIGGVILSGLMGLGYNKLTMVIAGGLAALLTLILGLSFFFVAHKK